MRSPRSVLNRFWSETAIWTSCLERKGCSFRVLSSKALKATNLYEPLELAPSGGNSASDWEVSRNCGISIQISCNNGVAGYSQSAHDCNVQKNKHDIQKGSECIAHW